MPRLPRVSGTELVKALERVGFVHVRTSGSHAILKRAHLDGSRTIPVPLHPELAPGTLLSILRQAGMTKEELSRLL